MKPLYILAIILIVASSAWLIAALTAYEWRADVPIYLLIVGLVLGVVARIGMMKRNG